MPAALSLKGADGAFISRFCCKRSQLSSWLFVATLELDCRPWIRGVSSIGQVLDKVFGTDHAKSAALSGAISFASNGIGWLDAIPASITGLLVGSGSYKSYQSTP